MRIRKLAFAALIAAVPTATAFAQGALDQSVPRVSPTTQPRVSPTTPSPTNPSRTGQRLAEGDTVTANATRTSTVTKMLRCLRRCRPASLSPARAQGLKSSAPRA